MVRSLENLSVEFLELALAIGVCLRLKEKKKKTREVSCVVKLSPNVCGRAVAATGVHRDGIRERTGHDVDGAANIYV